MGAYNIAVLNMQTDAHVDDRSGQTLTPANNFTVLRLQREIGRSNFGAMFVGRQGVGDQASSDDFNRAYGLDVGWQATTNGRLSAFLARTDSPTSKGASDYAGRAVYTHVNEQWAAGGGYTQVGDRFNPEVGFLRRRGYRSLEGRFSLSYQPKEWPWIRRIQPHTSFTAYTNLQNQLESSQGHWHFFDISTRTGARFPHQPQCADQRVAAASHRKLLRWRLPWLAADDRTPGRCSAALRARVDPRRRHTTWRQLQERPCSRESELRIHEPCKPAGIDSVQPAGLNGLVEHSPGAAQPQRDRVLSRLQRPPGHLAGYAGSAAREILRRQIHPVVRLLKCPPGMSPGIDLPPDATESKTEQPRGCTACDIDAAQTPGIGTL